MDNFRPALSRLQRTWGRLLLLLYFTGVLVGLAQVLSRKSSEGFFGMNKSQAGESVIVIVPVSGMITVSEQGQILGSSSSDRLVRHLKALSEREEVKAVVLRINSPGGSVGAVQEVYDEVLRLKKAGKKVVVSMGDVAASGGYYIAAPADKILADPGTLTGSIGVILQVGNFQELFKKIGVKIEAIKSAEHKDIASPFRTMTESERKILQSVISDAYGQFVQAVVQGRKLPLEKVLTLADGRIYTGNQARAQGLIDDLGNLETAITQAQEIAGIKDKPRVIYDEDPWGRIFTMFSQKSSAKIWDSTLANLGVHFAYLWQYSY